MGVKDGAIELNALSDEIPPETKADLDTIERHVVERQVPGK